GERWITSVFDLFEENVRYFPALLPVSDDDDQRAPCVVMSHGFSLTRHDGLAPFAEALAAAGSHVLVFDPRHLGDSGGTPRQRFRITLQREDWQAAVAHARSRP